MLKLLKYILFGFVVLGLSLNLLEGHYLFDGYVMPLIVLIVVMLADLSDKK